MSVRVQSLLRETLGELRHEPTAKRVRALLDGETLVDSTDALLVWEPRRVVPTYAVPARDIRGVLKLAANAETDATADEPQESPVLLPNVPFARHSTAGEPLEIHAVTGDGVVPAFLPIDDDDIAGYVLLDFAGFDTWLEEDDEIYSHPHDPFHRIDVRSTSRVVRLEHEGRVIAESSEARMLFETSLPTRYYLPEADVLVELTPSDTRTHCAYKGEARYLNAVVGDTVLDDIAWRYDDPLSDGRGIGGRIAFYDERLDVYIDGEPANAKTPGEPGVL